jgi:hypothetical protein
MSFIWCLVGLLTGVLGTLVVKSVGVKRNVIIVATQSDVFLIREAIDKR